MASKNPRDKAQKNSKQRKTHSKSRRGCLQCKKRHVKCDEQSPSCANCLVRQTECTYPASARVSPKASPTPSDHHHVTNGAIVGSLSGDGLLQPPSLDDGTASVASIVPSHSSSMLSSIPTSYPSNLTPSQSSVSVFSPPASTSSDTSDPFLPDSRKLLELELMHRWSTTTYLTLCSLPQDTHLMQTLLPRQGLKHPFVMQAIFAITALDLALNASVEQSESMRYMHAAMEYYDVASGLLRVKIAEAASEDYWMVFIVSSMACVYHGAMPRVAQSPNHTALGHVVLLFGLWAGTSRLSITHLSALLDGPLTSWRSMGVPDHSVLDSETNAVLNRLRAINDALHPVMAADPTESRPQQPLGPLVDPEPRTAHEAYRRAIYHLGSCFAEDRRGVIKSYAASYPGWNGQVFSQMVSDHDPMSLLILMYWGVLLDRLGKQNWWATSIGFTLVAELSDVLQQSHLFMLQDVQDAMLWAKQQVGLQTYM